MKTQIFKIVIVTFLFLFHQVLTYSQTGKCLDFGNSNDYVIVGDVGSVSDWTIELWFKPLGEINYHNVFHSNDLGLNVGIRLETSLNWSSGHLYAAIAGTNTFISKTIIPLSGSLLPVWQHVAIVGDKTNNKVIIYHNGVEVHNNSHTNWPTNIPNLVLGRGYSAGSERNFGGNIDEFRIWNSVRSSSDIMNNKDTELSGSEPGLIAYYKFNQGVSNGNNSSETTLYDITINGNNGTLTNFTLNGTSSNWTAPGFPGILPVELVTFTAERYLKAKAKISWTTASEVNSSHFEVEKSLDGIRFETIGTVKSAGTTLNKQEYSLIDEAPSTGLNYYRLKQVDLDGQVDYSAIEFLSFSNNSKIIIYPNPAKDILNIDTDRPENVKSILIHNQIGRLVYESKIVKPNIDISELHDGIYYITIISNQASFVERVIIKR